MQERQAGECFLLFVEFLQDYRRCTLIADWIEDHSMHLPQAQVYVDWLRNPATVRLKTVVEAVAQFGDKKSRRLIRRKLFRNIKTISKVHITKADSIVVGSGKVAGIQQGPYWKKFYAVIVGAYG